jgi:hypothetical protein
LVTFHTKVFVAQKIEKSGEKNIIIKKCSSGNALYFFLNPYEGLPRFKKPPALQREYPSLRDMIFKFFYLLFPLPFGLCVSTISYMTKRQMMKIKADSAWLHVIHSSSNFGRVIPFRDFGNFVAFSLCICLFLYLRLVTAPADWQSHKT